jgi:hypothetical protein
MHLAEHAEETISPGYPVRKDRKNPRGDLGTPATRWGSGSLELWGHGQTQAQQRVGKFNLAGAPALPAFLFTLGSSRKKDMARAQW